jgi:transcriptional regulator with XRE-family HTH domain
MTNDIFREKMKFFLKTKKITQTYLAEQLGIKPAQVNNFISGRERLGLKNAQKVATILGIDPLWLMTQGEQGIAPDEDAPPTQVATDDIINIPILSPDARGGFLPNDESDIEQYTIGKMPFNRQIAHTGDVVIPVYGDSMTPKYPAGSYILIRPIEAWREYIELGRSYVLELADWRRLIKIVRKGHDATHYTLDSYNVDYESNEIAKDFINNMWLVVASVTREEL